MNRQSRTWRPSASPAMLELRAAVLAEIRNFFAERDVMEVETPLLCPAAVTDPYIASISCTASASGSNERYLRTSPEFHMKRMLANGISDIYQIGKAFRDGEVSPRHQPEFTLIEWYRQGFVLQEMIGEACELICVIASICGNPIRISETVAYRELFIRETGCDPSDNDPENFRTSARAALGGAPGPQLESSIGNDRAAWLDLLASHVINPRLGRTGLTIVRDYPAAQAQLARLSPDDPSVAERFELFYRGTELANGYRELTNGDEQLRRFDGDRRLRSRMGIADVLPDAALLEALTAGLPECCGVAVGLDRVIMACTDQTDITEVISFPVE